MRGKACLPQQALFTSDLYIGFEKLYCSSQNENQLRDGGQSKTGLTQRGRHLTVGREILLCGYEMLSSRKGKSAFLFVRVKPYEFLSLHCRIIKRAPISNDKSKASSL